MYHSIGEHTDSGHRAKYDRRGLNIAPATFRKQLEAMRRANWCPVNLRDLMDNRVDIPAGKTPVAITFDDARGSQFRFLHGSTIDPNCAVGILDAFSRAHPDWPRRATFFVLPRSSDSPVPFWQTGREAEKLQYLVRSGYEVANHTTSHGWLSRMSGQRISFEVAEAIRRIRRLAPGATMDTLAVPYGDMPRSNDLRQLLLRGSDRGTSYVNRCVVLAWGGPTPSPYCRGFQPGAVTRIGTDPGAVEGWIRILGHSKHFRRYISDGDPAVVTVPRRVAGTILQQRLHGVRLVVIGPPSAPDAHPKRSKAQQSHSPGRNPGRV